jgi:hypothetical protein
MNNIRKTILLFFATVATGLLLLFVGHRYAATNVHGDWIISPSLQATLYKLSVVFPIVSIIVGIIVGSFEQKSRWWMAGISMLPILGVMFYGDDLIGLFFQACFFIALSLSASFVVNWWRFR